MKSSFFVAIRKKFMLVAAGATLLQATSCQTTTAELASSLITGVATNYINSLVFEAFGVP